MHRAFVLSKRKKNKGYKPQKQQSLRKKNSALEAFILKRMKETIGSNEDYLSENAIAELFKDNLSKSETAAYGRSKLMCIGEERSGKTSLRKALLNMDFDKDEGPSKILSVWKVDAEKWEMTTHKEFLEKLKTIVNTKETPNSPELMKDLHSEASSLSFMFWDFGGDAVFDSLQNLFLTEYGCYLLAFNCKNILNEESRENSLSFLKFWLFSKKIHAPKAPVILVGTHSDGLDDENLEEIDEIIGTNVLESNSFGEATLDNFCFVPVDSKTKAGIPALRKTIVSVVRQQKYIHQEVPVAFMRVLELMADVGKDFVLLKDVKNMARECGVDESLIEVGLKFLSYRGLITYFHQHDLIRRIIILRPQWLIDALRCVLCNPYTDKPKFDKKFSRDYRRFKKDRIISSDLLHNIWETAGYTLYTRKFLLRVMIINSLIGEYNFDEVDSYLVPAFHDHGKKQNFDPEEYQGPFFMIDFSGNYDPKIISDGGKVYVRYKPFGFFERLVSLCVEHSARFSESMQPIVGFQFAKLSFGVDVDFLLQAVNDHHGQPLWIKVSCVTDTKPDEAQDLLKRIYSMIDGLKVDFFSTRKQRSQLAVSILLPSSAETQHILADYRILQFSYSSMKETGKPTVIRPSKLENKKIELVAYKEWFENDDKQKVVPLLADVQYQPDIVPMKKLPKKTKYHCFLSYKQKSAIDIVGKQFLILKNKGYKCWYDQEFQGEINLQNMQKGVKESMCYVLFLSQDIFPSPYVEEELKTALDHNKPIILLHHPDTGKVGYWSFGDYIATAPEVLKPLFSEIESIQLQRRYYLEEAVTKLIDARLTDIHQKAMAAV